jgi:hypothetical protein
MSSEIHDWDGAYVLGALPPEERRRYEEHLSACSACSKAVRELAGIPGILGRLDPEEALALRDLPDDAALRADAHVPDRAAGVAGRIRARRRRARWTTTIVLVAVLAVGSVGGWTLVRALQPPAQQSVAARTLEPVGASHLSAALTMTPVGWGTRFDWSCDYRSPSARPGDAYGPTSYSLVVHTNTGTASTVATWSSDAGEARGLVAASAIPADTISSIDIRVTGSATPLASTTF